MNQSDLVRHSENAALNERMAAQYKSKRVTDLEFLLAHARATNEALEAQVARLRSDAQLLESDVLRLTKEKVELRAKLDAKAP